MKDKEVASAPGAASRENLSPAWEVSVMEGRLLLRVTDAAEILSVSRTKAYSMVRSGLIPSVKIDGCRRIRADVLAELVAQLSKAA